MEIRLASRQDIPAIMSLESRYYVGNLDEAERSNGFISVLHSQEWFQRAVDAGGVHIAVDEQGAVVGFMVVSGPPDAAEPDLPPIMRAMVDLAASTTFDGKPIDEYRYAFRGPVVIDQSARGRGVYSAFNEVMHEAYRGQFDVGVVFVAGENPRSLHTVSSKLGATPLAVFDVDSKQYHFMAFRF